MAFVQLSLELAIVQTWAGGRVVNNKGELLSTWSWSQDTLPLWGVIIIKLVLAVKWLLFVHGTQQKIFFLHFWRCGFPILPLNEPIIILKGWILHFKNYALKHAIVCLPNREIWSLDDVVKIHVITHSKGSVRVYITTKDSFRFLRSKLFAWIVCEFEWSFWLQNDDYRLHA